VRLTTENAAIVLDSTSDLPGAVARFPNWRVVPLYVRFGQETFRDYVDLSPGEFYERLRTAPSLPATSQPSPGDFAAAYDALASYERILSLHISGRLSGTVESARAAAAGRDSVRVVDSDTASAAIAMLALGIQRLLEAGTTDEDVDAYVARFQRDAGLLFTVDTLEFLARGGRIGRARAMAGQLLQVKPILTITHGEVVPLGRAHGSRKALAELAGEFDRRTPSGGAPLVGIAHADAPQRMAALRELVVGVRPAARIEVETMLGPVVGTHSGPGAVGLFWFAES
jgi:fatty acid kinase fatty acid binding subunit